MKRGRLAKFIMLLFILAMMVYVSVVLIGRNLEQHRSQESSLFRELFLQQSYEKVISEHERQPEEMQLSFTGLYYTGLSYYALKQYPEAVSKLELLQVLYPEQITPYILEISGIAYRYIGSFTQAARTLERVLEHGEAADSVYLHLIYCFSQLGEIDRMVETVRDYGLDDIKTLFWVVDTLERAGEQESALSLLQEANGMQDDLRIIERLALMQQRLGRLGEAEDILNSALVSQDITDRVRSRLLLRLGDIYYYQGHLLEARNSWRESSKLDPENTDAKERLK